jgi:hypothetical protein
VTPFDFLSLKNDVNVPSNSNKQKFFLHLFFVGILKVSVENSRILIQDPDPAPLISGMDPRIRIHSKMSWIRSTAGNLYWQNFLRLWASSLSAHVCKIYCNRSNSTQLGGVIMNSRYENGLFSYPQQGLNKRISLVKKPLDQEKK